MTSSREEVWCVRYRHVADVLASRFFMFGADRDDVRQEALVGIVEAARAWDGVHEPGPFVWLCATRQVQQACAGAGREKHLLLTGAVRHGRDDDGNELSIVDLLAGRDPIGDLEQREELARIVAGAARLTPLERGSLGGVLDGVGYRGNKRVDNAVQRARRKLREAA